jgi:hypothetical protein
VSTRPGEIGRLNRAVTSAGSREEGGELLAASGWRGVPPTAPPRSNGLVRSRSSAHVLGYLGSPLRKGRRNQGMMRWQLPPHSIFIGAQAMPLPDVATQRIPSPTASEANDIVVRHRSADRHCWGLRFGWLPQRQQGLIDSVDERRHFRRGKRVPSDVTADELCDQRLVNCPGGRSGGLHRDVLPRTYGQPNPFDQDQLTCARLTEADASLEPQPQQSGHGVHTYGR